MRPNQRVGRPGTSLNPPRRVYEVEHKLCNVRDEPHMEARVIAVKMRGQRVACTEITMDGWVRLADEPGWMATNLRGVQGLDEVMRPVADDIELAVEAHQAQGICCLEVVFAQVAVRLSPSRQAPATGFRKRGEYVFAHTQSFDGWVQLVGGEGWMLLSVPEHGTLLRPRDDDAIRRLDLWALCDVWSAMRVRRSLLPADIRALKDAEESVLLMTNMDFEHHVETGNAEPLVEDGLLMEEDLERTETWIRQRLFANTLARMVREEAPFSKLVPFFTLSPRFPPLELFVAPDSLDGRGGMYAGHHDIDDGDVPDVCMIEHEGRTYIMEADGMVFDPDTHEAVGVWNQETNQIEEVPGMQVAMVQVGDETYMLAADGTVYDPETEEPIGYMNPQTRQFEPIDPNEPVIVTAEELEQEGAYDPDGEYEHRDPDEPVDALGWSERARELAAEKYWYQSAEAYSEALKCCENERAVELEFECEILRGRAACWRQLRDHMSLLKDAERILDYDDGDKQALEWRRLANEALAHRR